ncbi:MAG: hypothetical protein Fur0039_03680 [Rhodocyclaceae bacterium]
MDAGGGERRMGPAWQFLACRSRQDQAVAANPIVASILVGTGLAGLSVPAPIDAPLALLGNSAAPLSLVALGMGLAQYGILSDWKQSAAICGLKLRNAFYRGFHMSKPCAAGFVFPDRPDKLCDARRRRPGRRGDPPRAARAGRSRGRRAPGRASCAGRSQSGR